MRVFDVEKDPVYLLCPLHNQGCVWAPIFNCFKSLKSAMASASRPAGMVVFEE